MLSSIGKVLHNRGFNKTFSSNFFLTRTLIWFSDAVTCAMVFHWSSLMRFQSQCLTSTSIVARPTLLPSFVASTNFRVCVIFSVRKLSFFLFVEEIKMDDLFFWLFFMSEQELEKCFEQQCGAETFLQRAFARMTHSNYGPIKVSIMFLNVLCLHSWSIFLLFN